MWPLVSEERTKQADRAAEGTGRTASSLALWPARGETLKGHSVSSTPGFPGGKQVAPVMNPAAAPAASPEEVGSQGAKFNYRPALKRSPKSASSLPFHFKVLSQKRKVKPSACRGGFISRFSASYMPDPQVGAGSKEKWKRKKKSEKKKVQPSSLYVCLRSHSTVSTSRKAAWIYRPGRAPRVCQLQHHTGPSPRASHPQPALTLCSQCLEILNNF